MFVYACSQERGGTKGEEKGVNGMLDALLLPMMLVQWLQCITQL